jgi:hypothetical protein
MRDIQPYINNSNNNNNDNNNSTHTHPHTHTWRANTDRIAQRHLITAHFKKYFNDLR